MQQKIVCFGDLVTFEWGQRKGFLGSQSEYQAANNLFNSLQISTHQFELVTAFSGQTANIHFTEEILSGCIFEIQTDDGKDFNGIPVKYGSEINLRLRRSGKRMHTTNDDSDALVHGSNSKNFSFRLNPKFKFNAERQYILYNDLVIFQEHSGRNCFIEEPSCKLTFSGNRFTPFRIHYFGVESPEGQSPQLMVSDIVQLYHSEFGGCMAAERRQNSTVLAGRNNNSTISEDEVPHLKRKSTKANVMESSTLWQIVSFSGYDKQPPSGSLHSSTNIKLRHILTDTYLTVITSKPSAISKSRQLESKLCLTENPNEMSTFQCVVQPHGSLEIISNALHHRSKEIEMLNGCNIRLLNVQSGHHIIVPDDISPAMHGRIPLCASATGFDGDIMRITKVSESMVQDIFILKIFHRALLRQLEELTRHPEINDNLSGTLALLQKLMQKEQGGILLERASYTNQDEADCRQQSAVDIGFVKICLKVANSIRPLSDNYQSHSKLVIDFVRTCYQVLDRLVVGNIDAVKILVELGGMHQMIVHLGMFGHEGVIPPISACLKVILNSANKQHKIPMISKHDIKLLLDQVYESLLNEQIPLCAQYEILSLICSKSEEGWMSSDADEQYLEEQQRIRIWVCDMLLGRQQQGIKAKDSIIEFGPRHSAMVYHTQLNANDELLISTTIAGQQRPSYYPLAESGMPVEHYSPVMPRHLWGSPIFANSKDWEDVILAFRQSIDSKVNQMNVEHVHTEFIQDQVSALHNYVQWRRINSLSIGELEFYKASLKLVSSVCLGRNFPCQGMVRKLIPVDHILYVIESLLPSASKAISKSNETDSSLLSRFGFTLHSSVNVAQTPRIPSDEEKDNYDDVNGNMAHSPTRDDLDGKVSISDLNTLVAAFNTVLASCYLDSAVLPPISENMNTFQVKAESNDLKSWENLFLDECYNKVFSLVSQEDTEFIEVSKSMAAVELFVVFAHCVHFLNTPYSADYKYTTPSVVLTTLVSPGPAKGHAQHEVMVCDPQSSFASMLPPLFGLTEDILWDRITRMNTMIVDELFNFLLIHRQERKKHAARRGINSLIQRARLNRLVVDWVEFDAVNYWNQKILGPIHTLNLLNLGIREAAGNQAIDKKSLGIELELFISRLKLLKFLVFRNFFDGDYNENPNYDNDGTPVCFYDEFENKWLLEQHQCVFRSKIAGMNRTVTVLEKYSNRSSTYGSSSNTCYLAIIANTVLQILTSSSYCSKDERFLQDEKIAMRYFKVEYGSLDEKAFFEQKLANHEGNIFFEQIGIVRILCSEILAKCYDCARLLSLELLYYSFGTPFANCRINPAMEKLMLESGFSSSIDALELFGDTNRPASAMKKSVKLHRNDQGIAFKYNDEEDSKFKYEASLQLANRLNYYSSFAFQLTSFCSITYPQIRDLFELLYFENDGLSHEILEFFVVLGNTRTDIAETIEKLLFDDTLSLTFEHQYLMRQRTLLSIVLEKFAVVGFRSQSECPINVRSYMHCLKNIIFNDDHGLCNIGLINFCSGLAADAHHDTDHVAVRDSLKTSLGKIHKTQEELGKAVKTVAIGKGESQRKLILRRHTAATQVTTEYKVVNDECMDDMKLALNLMQFPMNSVRQQILRNYEFHNLIIKFLFVQCDNIISESATISNVPSVSLLSQDLINLFALCVVFLRAFSADNKNNLHALSSRANFSLFLKLRNCHPEMVMLLTDIVRGRNNCIDDVMDENNLTDVFDEISAADESSSEVIVRSSNSIRIIEEILKSNHNGRLFDVVIDKVEKMLTSKIVLVMLGNVAGHPFQLMDGQASSYSTPNTSVPFLCEAFFRGTGLPAVMRDELYSSLPSHENEVFQAFNSEVKNWKFLPGDSYLAMQLRLISLLSTASQRSSNILVECRKFFGTAVGLLHFLNIDKYELRGPYLSLFMNLWITSVAPESIQADYASYSRQIDVLFSSLIRDIKKYLFFSVRLDTLDIVGIKYFTALDNYILTGVIPFYSKFLSSSVYILSKNAIDQLREGSLTLSGPLRMEISANCFRLIQELYQSFVQILSTDIIGKKSPRMHLTVRRLIGNIEGQVADNFAPTLALVCQSGSVKLAQFLEKFDACHASNGLLVETNYKQTFKAHFVDLFIPISLQLLDDWSLGNTRNERFLRQFIAKPEVIDNSESVVFKFCTNEFSRIIYGNEFDDCPECIEDFAATTIDPKRVLAHFIPVFHSSRYHQFFRRWTGNGTKLIQKLFSLLNSHIEFGEFRQLCDFPQNIVFWVDTFTKGILKDHTERIEEENKQDTMKMESLLELERTRLNFAQNAILRLGGTSTVMTMMRNWSSLTPMLGDDGIAVKRIERVSQIIKGKGIELGISLMEYGNENVQNSLTEITQKLLENSSSSEEKSHFLLTAGKLIQNFRVMLLKSNGNIQSSEFEEMEKLLRFLTLFTEGHNSKTQNFVRYQGPVYCVDLVVEVCSLVEDLSKFVADIMTKSYYNMEELAPKHCPSIAGRRIPVINWEKRKDSPDNLFKKSHILTQLCNTLTASVLALCEFSQGPCKENQQVVARSRALKYFGELFRFFGSFQLLATLHEVDESLEPMVDTTRETEPQWNSRFNASYKQNITFEGVFESPTEPLWAGNDPISIMLMVNRQNKCGTIPLKEDNGFLTSIFKKNAFGASAQINPKDDDTTNWTHTFLEFVDAKKDYIHAIQCHEDVPETNSYKKIIDLTNVLSTLEMSCINLINSIIESIDETLDFPQLILKAIKFSNLMSNMANYWLRYINRLRYTKKLFFNFDDKYCYEANAAFAYYGLVMRLKDLGGSPDIQNDIDEWQANNGIDITEHIARIEILGSNRSSLEVVYFPIPSLVRRYWRNDLITIERNDILFPEGEIKRDTIEEKLMDFLKRGEDLKSILKHYQVLDELAVRNASFALLSMIGKSYKLWTQLQFLLAMTLNIFLFLFYTRVDPHLSSGEDSLPPDKRNLFYALSFAMVCVGVVAIISDLMMKGWLYVEIGYSENPHNNFVFPGKRFPAQSLICKSFYYSFIGRMFVRKYQYMTNGDVDIELTNGVMTIWYYFTNNSTIYQWFLFGFSCVGFFINPIAYVGCMMEVLRISSLMRYVTKSFTANIDQVIAAVFLGAVIIYAFVAINITSPVFNHTINQSVEGCATMNQCARLHFDYGILQEPFFYEPGRIKNVGAEIFNFFYVFIVNIVLPGVVSGIIIDTFSELRGTKQAVYDDIVNNCFICGLKREDFEAESIDFADHTQRDHNMWKYLWFQLYLAEKNESDFTGCEQFVFSMLQEIDTKYKWLPLKKARCLTKMTDRFDLHSIHNKIVELSEKLSVMENTFNSQLQEMTEEMREDEK